MQETIFAKKEFLTAFDLARKYYSVLFMWQGTHLTNKQLDLLAFCAVRGTISTVPAKNEFCRDFQTSNSSINNLISELQRKSILKKIDGKTRVNPKLQRDFSKELQLTLSFEVNRPVDKEG